MLEDQRDMRNSRNMRNSRRHQGETIFVRVKLVEFKSSVELWEVEVFTIIIIELDGLILFM